ARSRRHAVDAVRRGVNRLPPALAASATPQILELLGEPPGRLLELGFAGIHARPLELAGCRRRARSRPRRARTPARSQHRRPRGGPLRRRRRAGRNEPRGDRRGKDRPRGRPRCRFNVGMTTGARYDGIADWYDSEFQPAPLESETWKTLVPLVGEGN